MAVDHAASLALTMRCCELMGRVEQGSASTEEIDLLRGLTPLTKLTTGRWSIAAATEAMEAIGGVGYCEDSTIPTLVRNTHVIPIWEGTTNVLALDFLRASTRSGALEALMEDAKDCVARADHGSVKDTGRAVLTALGELNERMSSAGSVDDAASQARGVAMGLATAYACARLCLQGSWAAERGDLRTAAAAARLVERGLVPAPSPSHDELAMDEELSSI
jgi:hypothetical protein